MTRKLLDEWRVARRGLAEMEKRTRASGRRLAMVTSGMAEPIMRDIARDIQRATGGEVRVVAVENGFFGPLVTVAGLLCGADVRDALAARLADFTQDDVILCPRIMLDNAGTRFLDDGTVADFEATAPSRIVWAKSAWDIAAAARTLVREPADVPTRWNIYRR